MWDATSLWFSLASLNVWWCRASFHVPVGFLWVFFEKIPNLLPILKLYCFLLLRKISPEYSLKDLCWSWSSNTLATWCKELTHWKRPWCWERLKAGGEGDNRGWDGWMASPTQWTWVWVNPKSWWWTGRPGVLCFMGSQRVGHDGATELNWTELCMERWKHLVC